MPEPINPPLFGATDVPLEDHTGPADITGVVLKDLSEAPAAGAVLPPSIAHSQELSVSRLEGQEAPVAGQNGQLVAADNLGVQPAGGPRRRSAQERISQLIGKNHAMDAENQELRGQLAVMNSQLSALTQQLTAPRQPVYGQPPVAAAQAVDPLGNLLNSGGGLTAPATPPAQSVAPALSALDVTRIVNEALTQQAQQQRAEFARTAALQMARERSFALACEEFPALRDGRTQARQTFNRLFDNSPLRDHPDGPYHVAMQVRGVLADEVARNQPAPQDRQALNLAPIPAQPSTSPVDISISQRGAIERDQAAAYAEMRAGDSSAALHKRISINKMKLREIDSQIQR